MNLIQYYVSKSEVAEGDVKAGHKSGRHEYKEGLLWFYHKAHHLDLSERLGVADNPRSDTIFLVLLHIGNLFDLIDPLLDHLIGSHHEAPLHSLWVSGESREGRPSLACSRWVGEDRCALLQQFCDALLLQSAE